MIEYMNIDVALVLAYLVFTLWVGIGYSGTIKNIETYALGGRNFSTSALAATITATYVSGSSFVIGITYGYLDGLLDFFAVAGTCIGLIFTSYVLIPRMGEFLGDLSLPESMRKLYGKEVGIIITLAGFVVSVGIVALQLTILTSTLGYLTGIYSNYLVLACAFVMIIYSMSGGIRAVVITDIVQFITFMIVVPGIGIGIWYQLSQNNNHNAAVEVWNHATALKSISGADYVTLFFLSMVPGFTPTFYQRVTASRDTKQASQAFRYSSYMLLGYTFISSIIGIMLFVQNPNIDQDKIFSFILDQYTFEGLRGITFIAVIAMAMSTVDSHLNTFGVMFTRDFCKQLGFVQSEESELRIAKIATVILGISGVVLTFFLQDMIEIIIFTRNFYEPIVDVAFLSAMIGFRSTKKPVLIGMFAGFAVVIGWKTFQWLYPGILELDSMIPAMLANIIFFFGAHYASGAPGGWVGPKDTTPLELSRKNNN
jgi:Na+/proline symporter